MAALTSVGASAGVFGHSIQGTESKGFIHKRILDEITQFQGVDTKPYILTNESDLDKTYQILTRIPRVERGFHVGVSCLHNFDIMCARRSCGAILFDASDNVIDLHKEIKRAILYYEDRRDFVKYIKYLPEKYRRDSFDTFESKMDSELEKTNGWLSSDENYQFIRSLFLNDKIISLKLDIQDYKSFQMIREFIDAEKLTADTIYVSNVGDWVQTLAYEGVNVDIAFRKMMLAIHKIATYSSIVIDSSSDEEGLGLFQNCYDAANYDPRLVRRGKITPIQV
ncbi:MAG: hypothetical protein JXA94_02905 [Parachlamydiales bacterium]|nr:hypothetical protein [Parachlamydiales bacterium]